MALEKKEGEDNGRASSSSSSITRPPSTMPLSIDIIIPPPPSSAYASHPYLSTPATAISRPRKKKPLLPVRPSPFAPYTGGNLSVRYGSCPSPPDTRPSPAIRTANYQPTPTSATGGASSRLDPTSQTPTQAAPEKELTLFAMRLAVLEKMASNVGTLAFVWATVVLLGGFAITMTEIDFWFVTVILVIEGARIFSRSHELEWQHQDGSNSSGSLFSRAYETGSKVFSSFTMARRQNPNTPKITHGHVYTPTTPNDGFDALLTDSGPAHPPKMKRTWSSSSVPVVPWVNAQASDVSRMLYWMQVIAAVAAIVLSVYRLCTRGFTLPNEKEDGTEYNHMSALFIFYSLAAFEAFVFVVERSYWEMNISYKHLLERVNLKLGLRQEDLGTTRRFFYEVYSKCLAGSVFEGLKMDMVDYALSWLQSDRLHEQLGGLRVLLTYSLREQVDAGGEDDTLRSVGIKQGAVERLLEMVTWKNPQAYHIRKMAAELLCTLVKSNRYSIRVASVSGSIEAIFSLLISDDDRDEMQAAAAAMAVDLGATMRTPATLGPAIGSHPSQDPSMVEQKVIAIRIVGLRILKNLAKDPLNSLRIGATRGLLTRLATFTQVSQAMLRSAEKQEQDLELLQVRKSLELLNLLAATPGSAGKTLRQDIARIVVTVSNLRSILQFGEAHTVLQLCAIEILSSLAMDEDVQAMIGRTGGVIRCLLALLLLLKKNHREGAQVGSDSSHIQLAQKAGEALVLLALKSQDNCDRMARLRVMANGAVVSPEEEEEEQSIGEGGGGGGGGIPVVEALLGMVSDWDVGDIAMNILRSFCAYGQEWWWSEECAKECAKQAVRIMGERGGRAQVAAMGLLAKVAGEVKDMRGLMEEEEEEKQGIGGGADAVVSRLVGVLANNVGGPVAKLPALRRNAVEAAVVLAECHPQIFADVFRRHKLGQLLLRVSDSVSDIEDYATFSGAAGMTRHSESMSALLDRGIHLFLKCAARPTARPSD